MEMSDVTTAQALTEYLRNIFHSPYEEVEPRLATAARELSSLAQDKSKRALLSTNAQDVLSLFQLYRKVVHIQMKLCKEAEDLDALAPERSCRTITSALLCLAGAPENKARRVVTAFVLFRSHALSKFAQVVTQDVHLLEAAALQSQQRQDGKRQPQLSQQCGIQDTGHSEGRRQQQQQQGHRAQMEGTTATVQTSFLSERRLRLYHSMDEAACLVGWIVDTMAQTNHKRIMHCRCVQCSPQQNAPAGPQPPPPPQQPLCLVSELWRALHNSQLLEAMVRGLLLLQDTLPEQGEQGGQGEGDGGASGGVAAAVRAARADQLRLAEAARQAFSVRPDRGTLASNLAWMPQGIVAAHGPCIGSSPAPLQLCRVSWQLVTSAGLVAAVAAAGGGTTYGLAPGPLVAVAGDVLPLLWECEEGGEAAAEGSTKLLGSLHERISLWQRMTARSDLPSLPVRLSGLVQACRSLVSLLVGHAKAAGGAGAGGLPSRQPQQLQQQQQQRPEQVLGGPAEEPARLIADEEARAVAVAEAAATGPSTPARSTWLDSVPRHVAISYAAMMMSNLSDAIQALRVREAGSHEQGEGLAVAGWRPLWWWRLVVELLPLLAEGRPEGPEEPEEQGKLTWQPLGCFHRGRLTPTLPDARFSVKGGMRWDLPRDMSHMLRAGLLPALERLVREGPAEVAARGEAEQSVAEVVLAEWAICRESVCRGGRAASDWDRLMAYTEPRQLAGLVSAIADVLRRGATAAEPNGYNIYRYHFLELLEYAGCAVARVPLLLEEVMRDEGFVFGDEAAVVAFTSTRGPLVCRCDLEACTQCRAPPVGGCGRGGDGPGVGSGGSGGTSGGGGASAMRCGTCPARRLAVNLSVMVQQLLPPLARLVLRKEQEGFAYLVTNDANDLVAASTLLCLRVLSDSYSQEQQQQQQGRGAPAGTKGGGVTGGINGGGSGSSSSSSSSSSASAAAAAPRVAPGPQLATEVHSWRELLLSLQPFRLLRLALQPTEEDRGQALPCAVWALALALPEEFAAALQSDPELTAGMARRVKGWEGSKPDHSLYMALQEVVPLLPPCKAVTALEGRCALPVVSRAKRPAARERALRLRGVQARVHVLVDMEEVRGVLEGVGA